MFGVKIPAKMEFNLDIIASRGSCMTIVENSRIHHTNGFWIGSRVLRERVNPRIIDAIFFNGSLPTVSYTHLTLPTKRIV